jgi:SH3-like domain-containing protein
VHPARDPSRPPLPRLLSQCYRDGFRLLVPALAVMLVLFLAAPAARALEKENPVHRYATLRSEEVNLRTGPGERYPIEWVLKRKGMPVEVVSEFDVWRKIRDWKGTEGWVHERMVTSARTAIVKGQRRILRSDPDGAAVAGLDPGVIGRLLECRGAWCRLDVDGTRGWLHRAELWGVDADETIP